MQNKDFDKVGDKRSETQIILTFLVATFLIGVTGALQFPVMSTFLKSHVHLPTYQPFFLGNAQSVSEFWIGAFFFLNACFGIFIAQFIGTISDKAEDRKNIIILGCIFAFLQCILYALSREYWTLLILGIILASIGGTVHAQLFAMAREFSVKRGKSSDLFTSTMRAGISLAWVLGPPIAFYLIYNFSFTLLYLLSAIGIVISLLMVMFYLPKAPVPTIKKKAPSTEKIRMSTTITLLMIACTLLSAANGMYLITIPLYIVETLNLSKELPGLMMGFVAGVEIPFIILVGMVANKISKRLILIGCAISAIIFYILIIFAIEPWHFITAQLFNAIFIGLLASIGIIYFQELMPNQAGSATTLFMNSGRLGSLFSGGVFAVIVQFFGYIGIFYSAGVFSIIALVCLCAINHKQTTTQLSSEKEEASKPKSDSLSLDKVDDIKTD